MNCLTNSDSLQGLTARPSIWKTYLGERPRCLSGDFSDYVTESEQLSRGWGAVVIHFVGQCC